MNHSSIASWKKPKIQPSRPYIKKQTSFCYSGSVTGHMEIGGIVGYNYNGSLTACYATGLVDGNDYVGGLVGWNVFGSLIACFWDVNTSGWTTSAGGEGKTTAQMKDPNTFISAGWDFVNIWDICEGTNYPRLQWQIPIVGDFACPYGVDFVDFAVMSSAWQSKPSDPDWNSACDISKPKDNFTGELDLAILCENWLEGTTP
jgi:hypothetical protein